MRSANVFHNRRLILFKIISSIMIFFAVFAAVIEISVYSSVAASAATFSSSPFTVKYIDVGQGDASLICCDGHYMLIDGGSSKKSDTIYSILRKNNIKELDYIVCTHPHEDHADGLPGALSYAECKTALGPVVTYDNDSYNKFLKALEKKNIDLIVPEAGDTYLLGSARIEVLGPTDIVPSMDPNNISIVLRVDYGDTSFLFTGDAEQEEQQLIMWNEYDKLDVDVLKASHHGSYNGASYAFIRAISPEITVISCGKHNSYGHPHEEALDLFKEYKSDLYRTDLQGDITIVSDGINLSVSSEKKLTTNVWIPGQDIGINSYTDSDNSTKILSDENAAKPEPAPDTVTYIGNKNSKKLHYPGCSSVDEMKETNKIFFYGDMDEPVRQGYEPCKRCNP